MPGVECEASAAAVQVARAQVEDTHAHQSYENLAEFVGAGEVGAG
jgi:hypothetical protein